MKMKIFRSIVLTFIFTLLLCSFLSISCNAEECSIPTYTVTEGTVYWESAWGGGSGRHAIISPSNPYTPNSNGSFEVCIDGYAILDARTGRIISAFFEEGNFEIDLPETTELQYLMVHIWGASGGHRLGWVNYICITPASTTIGTQSQQFSEIQEDWFEASEEKTTEETSVALSTAILEDTQIPRESVILADFSPSMADFHADVLERLQSTTVTRQYVFAEKFAELTELTEFTIYQKDYPLGGFTDIAFVLNSIMPELDVTAHIYLLTDLLDNCGSTLKANLAFEGEITIIYYPNDPLPAFTFFEKLAEAYPKAHFTGF